VKVEAIGDKNFFTFSDKKKRAEEIALAWKEVPGRGIEPRTRGFSDLPFRNPASKPSLATQRQGILAG
jgi:hypothetical protein